MSSPPPRTDVNSLPMQARQRPSARRRFQFTIRTLLLLVLVVSLGGSWLAVERARVQKTNEIVQNLDRRGALVVEDLGLVRDGWFSALIGNDQSVTVVEIWGSGSDLADSDSADIRDFSNLRTISLSETDVTDRGLFCLVELPSLRRVFVDGTAVTDAAVARFQELRPQVRIPRSIAK